MKFFPYLLLVSIFTPIYAMETTEEIYIETVFESEIPGEFIAENEEELQDFINAQADFPVMPMPTLKVKRIGKKPTEPKKEQQNKTTQEDTTSIYGYDIDKIMELSGAKFFLSPDEQRVLRIRNLGERPKTEQEKKQKGIEAFAQNNESNK